MVRGHQPGIGFLDSQETVLMRALKKIIFPCFLPSIVSSSKFLLQGRHVHGAILFSGFV